MLDHSVVTVGTTATELSAPQSDNQGGTSLLITAPAGSTVYLGGPTVTTTTYGYALAAGTSITVTLDGSERLYAVAAAAANVPILRQGI